MGSSWYESLLEDESYMRGLKHGLMLMLPIILILARRIKNLNVKVSAQQSNTSTSKPTATADTLGHSDFIGELHLFEVMLVAGAELKNTKDALLKASDGDEKTALNSRLWEVAQIIQSKLEHFTPIVRHLTTESIDVLTDKSTTAKKDE